MELILLSMIFSIPTLVILIHRWKFWKPVVFESLNGKCINCKLLFNKHSISQLKICSKENQNKLNYNG